MTTCSYAEIKTIPIEPIAIKYQWLVERLRREFPEPIYRVITKIGSYGAGFAIAVSSGSRRIAYLVEDIVSMGGVEQLVNEDEYDESGPMVMGIGPPYETKIIGLPNSNNPDRDVDKMIQRIRLKLGAA